MLPTTVFCRTRHGALALVDERLPLSSGFRRMLKLINGVRTLHDLRAEMPQLDEHDIAMWLDELIRKDLVAIDGMLETSELAFQMTSDMAQVMRGAEPANAGTTDEGNLIDDIVIDVALAIDPAPNSAIEKRLDGTGRMAAIESVSSFGAVGRNGFFVYPDAADGLPDQLRVCVASHEAVAQTWRARSCWAPPATSSNRCGGKCWKSPCRKSSGGPCADGGTGDPPGRRAPFIEP